MTRIQAKINKLFTMSDVLYQRFWNLVGWSKFGDRSNMDIKKQVCKCKGVVRLFGHYRYSVLIRRAPHSHSAPAWNCISVQCYRSQFIPNKLGSQATVVDGSVVLERPQKSAQPFPTENLLRGRRFNSFSIDISISGSGSLPSSVFQFYNGDLCFIVV